MDKVVVLKFGTEGGAVTIFGRKIDGAWSFWQEGTVMGLDENDEEIWQSFSSDSVPELRAILGPIWWKLHPVEVHPDFVAQIRQEYERCREVSGRQERSHEHNEWIRLLHEVGNYPDTECKEYRLLQDDRGYTIHTAQRDGKFLVITHNNFVRYHSINFDPPYKIENGCKKKTYEFSLESEREKFITSLMG
jgi:hypothetical protein